MRSGYASLLLTVALVVLPAAAFAVDIGTLHCNDATGMNLNIGTTVTVTGVVTEMENTNSNHRFFVQDATGGMNVFGLYVTPLYCPQLGDNVTVTGTIAQYFGMTELSNPLSFVLNSTGNPDPAPLALTPAQVNATFQADFCEPNEDRLIQVSCCYIRNVDGTVPPAGATFGSGNYRLYDVNDASSYCTLFIPVVATAPKCLSPQPMIGQPIPTGAVSVVGVLAQYLGVGPYTSGYEVIPRAMADFTACGACCNKKYGLAHAYCMMLPEAACLADGGTWVAGTLCPNDCAVVPAQKTTWGRIKTIYR